MFHQVNHKRSTFYPAMSVFAFKELCIFIKKNYKVITVSNINNHFEQTDHPAAIISFDDAHYDIIENALPILEELNLPFIINVDTEILKTGKPQDFVRVYDILNSTSIESYMNAKFMTKPIFINRLHPIITENEFIELLSNLSSEEKREFTNDLASKAGMNENDFSKVLSTQDVFNLSNKKIEFGSHSHTHPILTKIGVEQVSFELTHSKELLENIIGRSVDVLAYPNGVFDKNIEDLARSIGYSVFLETEDKINIINSKLPIVNSYKRVNQYHQTLDEALAHTYGMLEAVRKLLSVFRK